jgi:hypothetical protein
MCAILLESLNDRESTDSPPGTADQKSSKVRHGGVGCRCKKVSLTVLVCVLDPGRQQFWGVKLTRPRLLTARYLLEAVPLGISPAALIVLPLPHSAVSRGGLMMYQ